MQRRNHLKKPQKDHEDALHQAPNVSAPEKVRQARHTKEPRKRALSARAEATDGMSRKKGN
jgi:hypothetical protein